MEIDELTTDELREIASSLEDAQGLADKVDYLTTAKMPCPECGGSGSLSAGSLGSMCPGCMGARYLDHPAGHGDAANPAVKMLADMRRNFSTYATALDGRRAYLSLPDGVRDSIDNIEGPTAAMRSAVPTVEAVEIVVKALVKSAQSLPSTPQQPRELAEARNRRQLEGSVDESGWEDLDGDDY